MSHPAYGSWPTAVSDKLKNAIEGLALQKPPLPVTALYRQVLKLSRDRGEKPPSYGTVFNIVRGWTADLVTLAHEGTKAYSNAFELLHRREANGPNAIWQADHTPLDILLIRPDGEAAKPWLTTVIDDYSRAVAESISSAALLIIDDFGMRKLPSTAAEDLLEIVMRRYERASTLLTSNRPVDDWGKILGDVAAVGAILDRLLHHGHVLKCGPKSWRTKTAPAE